MFFLAIWDEVSLQKHDEIARTKWGQFLLKTNEGYLSQIAPEIMQLVVNYTLLLV